MNRFRNQCVLWAGLLGAAAVALGAFGAHGLQEPLSRWYPESHTQKLATWNTAVTYQFYHALAILALGSLARGTGHTTGERSLLVWLRAGVWAMSLGVAIFSGLLYALVLTDVKILGAFVPVGGVLMIAGWLCVAASVLLRPATDET